MMAVESLRETFLSTGGALLPDDRRLKQFRDQPFHRLEALTGGNKDKKDKYILLWAFEHKLKELYAKFLQVNSRGGLAKE